MDALERCLSKAGFRLRRLTRPSLNGGHGLQGVDVLVIGGGYAHPGLTRRITHAGKKSIRNAVSHGMGVVAICAGAYFISKTCMYQGVSYGPETGYDLAIYPGVASGPIPPLAQYPSFGIAAIRYFEHPSCGDAAIRHVWYSGGPCFKDPPAGTETLAVYELPGTPGHNVAAAVAFQSGKGRVILLGPHLEVTDRGTEPDNQQRLARMVRWACGGGR